jgi:hypothetical protein
LTSGCAVAIEIFSFSYFYKENNGIEDIKWVTVNLQAIDNRAVRLTIVPKPSTLSKH